MESTGFSIKDLIDRVQFYDKSFARAALKYFAKNIDEPNERESLITAVQTEGMQSTSCIRLKRTLAGKIQVSFFEYSKKLI